MLGSRRWVAENPYEYHVTLGRASDFDTDELTAAWNVLMDKIDGKKGKLYGHFDMTSACAFFAIDRCDRRGLLYTRLGDLPLTVASQLRR